MFNFKKKAPVNKISRTEQLQSDFKRVTGLFKSHPNISIKETFGSPPDKYHVLYRIDGLQKVKNTIEMKNEHMVEIVLPQKYPEAAPVCTRVSPVFHPNIAPEIIDIKGIWGGGAALADLFVGLGQMITFQKYDTSNPLNSEAAKWADRNMNMLPLSKTDLHYREPASDQDEMPGTEVIIQEQQASDTPPPEDGRKTEGIIINADTSQFQEVSSNDKSVEMRKTALLDKGEDTKILSQVPEPQKPLQPPRAPAPVKQAVREQPKPAPAPAPVKPAARVDPKPATTPAPAPVKQAARVEPKPAPTPPPVKQAVREEPKPAPAPAPAPAKQAAPEEPKPAPAPPAPVPIKQAVREEPKPAPAPAVPVKQAAQEEPKPSPAPVIVKLEEPPVEEKDKETEWSMSTVPRGPAPAPAPKEAAVPVSGDDFFCWQCGSKNHRGANFCSNCGTKLWQESAAAKKGSLTRILLVSSLIAIPAAIIVAGVTLVLVQPKTPPPQALPAAISIEKKTPAVVADTTPAPIIPVPKPQPAADTAKILSAPTAESVAKKLAGTGATSPVRKQAKIEETLKNAQLYLNLGSFDEAADKYMEVLTLDPKNDDALDGLRMVRDAKDKAASTDTSKR
jgi:ubiquitin-protein ligase